MRNHIAIEKIPYSEKVKKWLADRYGSEQAQLVWQQVVKNYNGYCVERAQYSCFFTMALLYFHRNTR